MGIKNLNLQMIPWCLHLMGNHISCLHLQPEPPVKTIKLIKSDGVVKIYHRSIHVSELLVEFPKHLVCRSDSFFIGQKIPALSEDEELQLGQKYFLLPNHYFQSVLSFVTIASFVSQPKNAFVKKAAHCQPFDIQKAPSGCLQIRVSDEFISQLMEEGRIDPEEERSSPKSSSGVCTTPQLAKDYAQLVGSRPYWKPKLETIREKEKRKLSSFRRKKSHSKGTGNGTQHKSQRSDLHPHHHNVSSSKAKLKLKSRK